MVNEEHPPTEVQPCRPDSLTTFLPFPFSLTIAKALTNSQKLCFYLDSQHIGIIAILKALSALCPSGTQPVVGTISQVTLQRPGHAAEPTLLPEGKREEKKDGSKKRCFPFCSHHGHSQPWLSFVPITSKRRKDEVEEDKMRLEYRAVADGFRWTPSLTPPMRSRPAPPAPSLGSAASGQSRQRAGLFGDNKKQWYMNNLLGVQWCWKVGQAAPANPGHTDMSGTGACRMAAGTRSVSLGWFRCGQRRTWGSCLH